MAESAGRDGSSRRQSFRRSLADAALPDDALERLEAKRRQLDDSIHKYIASKEREYKSFEKEEIHRHKLGVTQSDSRPRRASSESTQDNAASPQLPGQQQNVVDALLSAGLRRENIGQPHSVAVVDEDGSEPTLVARPSLAGLTDRRASLERDKEFIGVFTPTFLPALEQNRGVGNSPTRADAAPPGASMSGHTTAAESENLQRAHSDSLVQAKQKRPIQLQLASRTSSSGSSADGGSRLPSALKSPTHPRPKRKRVSLALGDAIVAPSDNVPITLGSNNSTPSHSRTRSPASERNGSSKPSTAASTSSPRDSPQQAESATAPFSSLAQATMTSQLPHRLGNSKGKQSVENGRSSTKPSPLSSRPDVDRDLDFALDEDDMIPDGGASSQVSRDRAEEIMGRIKRPDEDTTYRPSEEMISEESEPRSSPDGHAEHIEFHPGSVQQTGNPGFRRPSVSADPVYTGRNYDQAEHNAVTNEIYGSSYARPRKGSFTAGSLGESFMATNAARMMKDRRPSEQAQVRS
ncbi:hypothetical protein Slin15195_G052350 [Septoria linicola]|uniref:Uncharacterized protein n=1 Tax=Septoria linicola TaxID=215465 RepID=A0A9Q9EHK7_9PEZI|nr:hypothetical protein Slin15195_G052350 [Septoria linicola]